MAEISYKDELIEMYHNIYKSYIGIRPRHIDFESMTVDQLQAAVINLDQTLPDYDTSAAPTSWIDPTVVNSPFNVIKL